MSLMLLIPEPPIQVLPSLAVKIGINEAMMLQQIHYWVLQNARKESHFHEGYVWMYNSIPDWKNNNFPWLGETTIKKTIKNLEVKMLIFKGNFNKLAFDRTAWYRVNYESELLQSISQGLTEPLGNIRPMDQSKVDRPIPEITQRLATENKASCFFLDYCLSEDCDLKHDPSPSKQKKYTEKSPECQQIYDHCWKKVNPTAAKKSIAKILNNGVDYHYLLDAVVQYSNSVYVKSFPKHEKKFLPHPATWFNAGGYDSDRSEWKIPHGSNKQATPQDNQIINPFDDPNDLRGIS